MPDELDPQIREFTSQLRRLVDRSGLSIASVADRTGYSKTSWERYLNGRLLAPKGAIVALAEVTETNPVHLTTMWELAERAWSRSEMRHDMTMEAIRISQARAALGEFGGQDFGGASSGSKGEGRSASAGGGKTARRSGSTTVTPGIAGPAGVSPTVPVQPTAPEVQDSTTGGVREDGDRGGATEVNSWGLAGYKGPSPTGGRGAGPGGGSGRGTGTESGSGPRTSAAAPGGPAPTRGAVAGSHGAPPRDAVPAGAGASGGSAGSGAKRRITTFVAGVVGVLVVITGAFYLTGGGGDDEAKGAAESPSPIASKDPDLPPGVKCSGDSCTGKDAEAMGCSGDLVTTARTATVGTTTVEVRYSETCKAAWGRITQAAQGDEVRISAGEAKQTGSITEAGDPIAYTPMVAVKNAAEARACATLAAGGQGCTE
ncbi:helix-turn-helix domain-containing protein [Streptomyces djakartensis]|uniref:helix-turn-helix domain-containing protein n=1 Tax=Streptomyces djakartensis TaxID=68193 RepID=UPI001E34D0B5|nr:XRE family transcriptional regulator [Streptomyces djakartensis]